MFLALRGSWHCGVWQQRQCHCAGRRGIHHAGWMHRPPKHQRNNNRCPGGRVFLARHRVRAGAVFQRPFRAGPPDDQRLVPRHLALRHQTLPHPRQHRDRMQGLTPNPPPGGGGRRTPEALTGMARAVAIRAEAGLKPALTRLQTTRASLLLKPRTQPATPAGLLRPAAPCENRVVARSDVPPCRL